MLYLIAIIFVLLIFIDIFYLTTIGKLYNIMIKNIQGNAVKLYWPTALLCYLALSIGLYYFIIRTKEPIINSFYLGLLIYSVFELVNYSVFSKWKLNIVLIDSIWGGILLSIVTYIIYKFNIDKDFHKS